MKTREDAAFEARSIQVVPSRRQLAFQQTEFYAFVHFTVNTFTGREWGDGTEPESCFNPGKLDAGQWAESIRSAGMRGAILTCKHHDGFCLWPSRYTDHTLAKSPYRNGQGDIVREFSDACRRQGLKFGIYLSPWDRNSKLYGAGKAYDDYFVHQLTELLTGYGPVFSVWLDGACGEGPNGKRQVYDWDRYYQTVRRLQPMACISVCGPDVRWCGNEAGHTRKSEWSIVPRRMQDTEKIKENSQQEDNNTFRQRKLLAGEEDLGSREAVRDEPDLIWYPAEVNTSIRPGWFYHKEEDGQVKSLQTLIDLYEKAVGGNATLLLNIPPTPEGLFHENDTQRLKELGDWLEQTYRRNLAEQAVLIRTENTMTLRWNSPVEISRVVLMEDITKSQRVEAFAIRDGSGSQLFQGTVIGYKKIVPLAGCRCDTLTIQILESRMESHISFVGVYGQRQNEPL